MDQPIAHSFARRIDPAQAREIARMRAELASAEALLVRPAAAEKMLGIGHKQLYALMNAGELESFAEGRRRFITVQSIRDYLARKLAAFPIRAPKPRRRSG